MLRARLAAHGGTATLRCAPPLPSSRAKPITAGNVLLYDVTHAGRARLLRQEALRTSPRNDRSFLTLDWLLPPRHVYRVLCRVTELRASPRHAQAPAGTLANRGALSFAASDPCAPAVAGSAVPDDTTCYLELRYRITAVGEQR